MDRRLTSGLLAAAAALTAAGVVATGASAAPAHPDARANGLAAPVFTPDRAGYRAGFGTGWRFRWITTTFTVPSCADAPARYGWTDNGVALGPNGQTGARLKVECDRDGDGAGAGAGVDCQLTAGATPGPEVPLPIAPHAGHSVTTSIYYDQAQGMLRFTVTDDTTGSSTVRAVGVGTGRDYLGAGAGSFFNPRAVTPPPADVRTGAFSGTHLTSYDATRGSLPGPWPTSEIVATTTGTVSGDVIANAPTLWNSGENFGVWERTSARR